MGYNSKLCVFKHQQTLLKHKLMPNGKQLRKPGTYVIFDKQVNTSKREKHPYSKLILQRNSYHVHTRMQFPNIICQTH